MKRVAVVVLCSMLCAGCAAQGAVEEQIQKLRSEMSAQMKQSEEAVRKDYSRDLLAAQETLQADYARKLQDLKKELSLQKDMHEKDLNLQKDVHEKDLKEVNRILIDVQKDFFQNRRVTEENVRRVYILESLFAATRPAPEDRAEGEILYFKDGSVTTNLGTKHGVKAGDVLAVFKDETFKEKIATVRVMVAEASESKGELVEKTVTVTRGNFVKPAK